MSCGGWGPEVVDRLGFFSVVSYLLFYGKDRSAFSSDDVEDGMALAAHVGVALAGALEVENLEKAFGGRTVTRQCNRTELTRPEVAKTSGRTYVAEGQPCHRGRAQ